MTFLLFDRWIGLCERHALKIPCNRKIPDLAAAPLHHADLPFLHRLDPFLLEEAEDDGRDLSDGVGISNIFKASLFASTFLLFLSRLTVELPATERRHGEVHAQLLHEFHVLSGSRVTV